MERHPRHSVASLALSVVGIVGIFLLTPEATFAIEAEFSIAHSAVIAKSSNEVRILLAPEDLAVLNGELVTSAFLDLPLSGLSPSQDVNIYMTSLGTNWVGRNPTWTTPWSTPGGDLDEAYARAATLAKGRAAQTLSIDVTQIVREIAVGQVTSNGFLLTALSDTREGFSADEASVVGTLSEAKLKVKYIKTSALR